MAVNGINAEVRSIDAAFVMALVFALRRRRLRISPGDAWTCMALARSKAAWTRAEITAVLSALLVRRPGEAAIFEAEFGPLFDRSLPTSAPIRRPAEPPQAPDDQGGNQIKRSRKRWLRDRVQRIREVVRHAGRGWGDQWKRLVRGTSERLGRWTAVAGAISASLTGFYLLRGLLEKIAPGPRSETSSIASTGSEVLLGIDAAIAAIALTGLGLLIWRAVALSRQQRECPEEEVAAPRSPPPTPDGTIFRIGSLGGRPPAFLPPATIGAEIAEMIGYRPGEPDPRRLDARLTIAAHARGADPLILIPGRRRELPGILLLVDRGADACYWHTLADEFRAVLQARGIATQCIDFRGSFFTNRAGQHNPRPEALAVDAAIAAPGWTVTTVFGQVHRLGRPDIDLFRRVSENGPIVFFELRDRTLWDGRHAALKAAGVALSEATAVGLRDALARIFAPDRAHTVEPSLGRPPEPDGPSSVEAAIAALGEEGGHWASDCALVDPISFALAEKLRDLYPTLRSSHPSLAFSRLSSLPGVWSGPEGLRLYPQVRRRLLTRFALRRLEDRARTLAIVDAAFDAVKPIGVSATIIRAYAKSFANVFSDNLDAALKMVFDAESDELLDPAPIRDFLDRLWVPGAVTREDEELIRLPSEPHSAAMRRRLFPRPDERDRGDGPNAPQHQAVGRRPPDKRNSYWLGARQIVPARWSLGLPSTRNRIPESLRSLATWAAPNLPVSSFLTGRHLLIGSGEPSEQARLSVFDTLRGAVAPVAIPADLSGVATIVTARGAPVAAIGSFAAEWYLLRVDPGESVGPAPLQPQNLYGLSTALGGPTARFDRPSPAAIDPAGRFLFVGWPGQNRMLRCRLDDLNATPTVWQLPQEVTSLGFLGETIFVGLAGGAIVSGAIEASAPPIRDGLAYEIGGDPTAMAVVHTDGERPYAEREMVSSDLPDIVVIAGREDGTVVVHDGERQLAELRLGRSLRRIVAYPEKSAARVRHAIGAEPEEAGLSVAILGQDGFFDIIGFPLRPLAIDGSVPFTAMSLLDRRVAASDGTRALAIAAQSSLVALIVTGNTDSPGRIEVRPLDYALPAATRDSVEAEESALSGNSMAEPPTFAQVPPPHDESPSIAT